MQKAYQKYRDVILYIFFGGCTTAINLFTYYASTRYLGLGTAAGTLLAWWVAVVFAYLTNRKLVFHSSNKTIGAILLEFLFFILCRLLTGLLDVLIMYFFVDRLGCPDLFMKPISNLVVILANYLASRWLIFKRHTHERQEKF
jgi:putative flippase GtrA